MNAAVPALAGLLTLGPLGPCAFPGGDEGARTPPPCPADSVVDDVDGDGAPDRVFGRTAGGEPHVVVCFADGTRTQGRGRGLGNAFLVADLDGDGDREVLAGEQTTLGQTFDVLRLDRVKRLRPTGITLRGGKAPGEDVVRYGWGCEDGRVVQVDVDWEGRSATVTTWTFGDAVTRAVRTERVPDDATHPAYMTSIVGPCQNVRGRTP